MINLEKGKGLMLIFKTFPSDWDGIPTSPIQVKTLIWMHQHSFLAKTKNSQ